MAEQTLNIPQIIVFIIVTVLAVRWFMSKPAATDRTRAAGANNRAGAAGGPRINTAQVDQIAQMFPQLDRRTIAWEFVRNNGNMAAVTEKVLSGRTLETPPPTFQFAAPTRSPTPSTRTPKPATKPDLITRYNLSSKIAAPAPESAEAAPAPAAEQPKPKAWSQDRSERQSNLQRRREEMILAARRKMEEKDRAKA